MVAARTNGKVLPFALECDVELEMKQLLPTVWSLDGHCSNKWKDVTNSFEW